MELEALARVSFQTPRAGDKIRPEERCCAPKEAAQVVKKLLVLWTEILKTMKSPPPHLGVTKICADLAHPLRCRFYTTLHASNDARMVR